MTGPLHIVPVDVNKNGGIGRDHHASRTCWCGPVAIGLDLSTGAQAWQHANPQRVADSPDNRNGETRASKTLSTDNDTARVLAPARVRNIDGTPVPRVPRQTSQGTRDRTAGGLYPCLSPVPPSWPKDGRAPYLAVMPSSEAVPGPSHARSYAAPHKSGAVVIRSRALSGVAHADIRP